MPNRSPADPDLLFDGEFERHWLAVFRFAVGWTNDWAAAEDIAQEAFLRLWSRRNEMEWSASTLPWLLTTSRHLATDRFRQLRRVVRLAIAPGTPDALDSDARLRWLDVKAGMAALTPLQRSALVMTAVIGLDSETAARVLGTTPGAVRAAANRARSALVES